MISLASGTTIFSRARQVPSFHKQMNNAVSFM
jgi:hypothetical protein